MTKRESLLLFDQRKALTVWDNLEKMGFSIGEVLIDSKDALTARKYWNKLKQCLSEDGYEAVTNCY